MIGLAKKQKLARWMLALGISEDDLIEKFIVGSGSGGQKLHKTASCVYLQHLPTGIEIKCQQDRSRENNRYYARQRLCEKVEEIVLKEKSKKRQANEKIRRQKRKRSKRAQKKVLDAKSHRGVVKKSRQTPSGND